MKAIRNLLIGVILGAVIGWVLGFLRFPYIEKNLSFLLGFLASLAFVSFVLILLFVWKKNSLLVRWISKDPAVQNSNNARRTYAVIWILVSVFIVFGGLISSFLIYRQNQLFEIQTQRQDKRIQEQSELIESIRNGALLNVMNNIVDQMNDELNHNPKRILSDETIARIAALSYSFTPYYYVKGDSIASKKLSPERGELLLIICGMNIDSTSLDKIMEQSVFASALLRKADLQNAFLKGANLQGAELREANLEGVNLSGADLRSADLWGVNLKHASLISANLQSADLSWSDLNGASLSGANLNKTVAKSAQLRKTDLHLATLHRTNLSGSFLNEANLQGADMLSVIMIRTNLSNADLTRANLTTAALNESNLTDANLNGVIVSQRAWLTLLNDWRVLGATKISNRYQLIADTATLVARYHLSNR